jgi:hypothetical protein
MCQRYNLQNQETGEIFKTNIELSKWEADTLNNAYNTNMSQRRYVESSDYVPEDATEVNLFNFNQPI